MGRAAFCGSVLALVLLHGCGSEPKAVIEEPTADVITVSTNDEDKRRLAEVNEHGLSTHTGFNTECPGVAGAAKDTPSGDKCFVPKESEVYPKGSKATAEGGLKEYLEAKVAQGLTWGCFDCRVRGCYGDEQTKEGVGIVLAKIKPESPSGADFEYIAANEPKERKGAWGCSAQEKEPQNYAHPASCVLLTLWTAVGVPMDGDKPKNPISHCPRDLKNEVEDDGASLRNAFLRRLTVKGNIATSFVPRPGGKAEEPVATPSRPDAENTVLGYIRPALLEVSAAPGGEAPAPRQGAAKPAALLESAHGPASADARAPGDVVVAVAHDGDILGPARGLPGRVEARRSALSEVGPGGSLH